MKPVKHIKIKENMKVSELVEQMKDTAFNAKAIAKAVEILLEAKKEKCKIFCGMAGALVPGGMRQIIIDMLKEKIIDVFVTTGANLTHDLIEALGLKHYQGSEKANDVELYKKGYDRIYNVYMQNKVYQRLEKFFIENFEELNAETNSEFLQNLGRLLKKNAIYNSILTACYENKIPVFCPALSDSGIGLMIWSMLLRKKIPKMNEYKDLAKFLDLAWYKKKAVFYVGGGVPKNYIQQAMQFSSPALYGVQIKVEHESFGGSSGASLKEGISWGKLHEKAKFVDIECDATIALPLIYAALISKIKCKK
ncbi:MAG: deoxyhypusine synthase family protein [Candidatus Pacearchaeota archaeon]